MSEWMGLALVFAATSFSMLVLLALVRPRETEVLSDEPASRWFGFLTPGFAGMIPATDSSRHDIQQELYLAGYYQPAALDNFLSMRNLLTVLPLLGGLFAAWQGPDEWFVAALATGLTLSVLGYAVPRVMLKSEGKARADRLRAGMPVLMDTMALCLSSGGALKDSLCRAGDSIRRGYPDLAHEVKVVCRHAELRSLEHALTQWKSRIPLPELATLVYLVAQGDRLGTDITGGLWELSASYRVTARQAAETAANKISFQMLFPTVFCLLGAAMIIMVGPGLLQAVNEGGKIREAIDEAGVRGKQAAQESQDRLNELQGKAAMPTPVRPVGSDQPTALPR